MKTDNYNSEIKDFGESYKTTTEDSNSPNYKKTIRNIGVATGLAATLFLATGSLTGCVHDQGTGQTNGAGTAGAGGAGAGAGAGGTGGSGGD